MSHVVRLGVVGRFLEKDGVQSEGAARSRRASKYTREWILFEKQMEG